YDQHAVWLGLEQARDIVLAQALQFARVDIRESSCGLWPQVDHSLAGIIVAADNVLAREGKAVLGGRQLESQFLVRRPIDFESLRRAARQPSQTDDDRQQQQIQRKYRADAPGEKNNKPRYHSKPNDGRRISDAQSDK